MYGGGTERCNCCEHCTGKYKRVGVFAAIRQSYKERKKEACKYLPKTKDASCLKTKVESSFCILSAQKYKKHERR